MKVYCTINNIISSYIVSTPDLSAVSFYQTYPAYVYIGYYVNLTVQVTSDTMLTSTPMWSMSGGTDLPSNSWSDYEDGSNYTSLIFYNASYQDLGRYYLNASNHCGPSSISVLVQIVRKGKNIHS